MTSAAARCGLRIIHITDTYTLRNLPSLKTLIQAKSKEFEAVGKTVVVHTGDFLAPYTLSAFDRGAGMVDCFNALPVDFLCWGNHEDDVEHSFVCERTRQFQGTWLNSNMQDHETFQETQKDCAVVEATSQDASHTRKIGLLAVLSNDPGLYRKGAFGGAVIADPWETLRRYKLKLEQEHNVDLVLPLSHLYVADDVRTCEEFDFPLILGGHDHHVVNEVFHGTRLCKPGANAHFAIAVDITWENAASTAPLIATEVLNVTDYTPDQDLQAVVATSEKVLAHLRNTELCIPPERFHPFNSLGARERPCTAATFLCSAIKKALNSDHDHCVDAVVITGGSIGRGNQVYAKDAFFSMDDLDTELDRSCNVILLPLPGMVVREMVRDSHAGAPNPGYLQTDEQVLMDSAGFVTSVDDEALDVSATYTIATTAWDCFSGSSRALRSYVAQHPEVVPPSDAAFPAHHLLLGYFADNVWRHVFAKLDANSDGRVDADDLRRIDTDGDGLVTREELASFMKHHGVSCDLNEPHFLQAILAAAGDDDADGKVQSPQVQQPRERKPQNVASIKRHKNVITEHT